MKKQRFAITISIVMATTTLLVLLGLIGSSELSVSIPAHAAPAEYGVTAAWLTPTIVTVDPVAAPNDIDTPIVIQGSNFTATLSGTVVITAPTVYLGDDALPGVTWFNSSTISATVPWGLAPEVYSLTVVNPDGISATLQNAFTVTNGIGVWATGGPYGGHISQIRIHPDNPSTIFAVAFDMGVFVSYDAGTSWEPFLMKGLWKGVEFDAQNRDVMYLGSRYRTMDGGETWETLTIHTPIPFKGWNYYLTADPVKAGRLYAAANTNSLGITGNVLRSDNYGEYGSWITLTESITDKQFTAVAVNPTDNDTLLAGTENGNIYYSQNGGQDWQWATKIENAIAKLYFNPYESLEAWATALRPEATSPYLHKSTDLTTWTPVDIDPSQTHMDIHGWSLAFLPDKIWAGAWGVYTSTNGGDSWAPLDRGGTMSLDVHPNQPQSIYSGDFTNGVFKSVDEGDTWQESSEGLSGVFPSALQVAPDDPQVVYVKIDPGLFKSENGGQSWRWLEFGGGYPARTKLAIDPFQPDRIYFGNSCPISTCLWISADGGDNWISTTATLPAAYAGWDGGFYTLAPHPDVPGKIFAGVQVGPPENFFGESQGLFYLSNDYGVTWNHIGPTQPISVVREIAFDAQNPDLIYIGTQGSGLWKSSDGGQNWVKLPSPAGLEYIDTIATHPEIGEIIYVGAGDNLGGPTSGVYLSDDAGDSWTFLAFGIGGQLLFAPTYPLTLYGKESTSQYSGLVRSTDGGQTWERMVDSPRALSLAAGSDGDRVVLYIGSVGGVTQVGTQTTSRANIVQGETTTIFGGGVYRLTTLLPTDWVYLPLVLRGCTP